MLLSENSGCAGVSITVMEEGLRPGARVAGRDINREGLAGGAPPARRRGSLPSGGSTSTSLDMGWR